MHPFMLVALLALLALSVRSASQRTTLQLSGNGTYKIAQFADIHYADGAASGCKNILPEQEPCSDLNSTIFMGRVLDIELPDLAVFTGDNIHDPTDPFKAIADFTQPVTSRGVNWATVFGNHDEDTGKTTEELMEVVMSLPYSVSLKGPEEVFGIGNFVIQILNNLGENVLNLYFLDSGAYSKNPSVSGYEWIRPSQINWYLENAREIKEENGGKVVPALMYFHIPIPEYDLVSEVVGDAQEVPASANVNSGLFSAILEAGDVKATFVGHNHLNDYCGVHHGIYLCYAGGFGYHAYGKEGWERRSRIVEVRDNGKTIATWKRLDDDAFSLVNEQIIFQA